MEFINSLTLNGQRFTIQDPNAVPCTAQALTEEQKAQARENIGAVDEAYVSAAIEAYVDEAILGGAW